MREAKDIAYFQEIFYLYHDKIVSFLCHYCKDREEAKCIAQDTFESVWLNLDKIDRSRNPLPYIYFIAKNKALNVIKRELVANRYTSYVKYRDAEISYKALSSLTMDEVQANDLQKAIRESLNKMKPNTAETFVLSRFKGLKNAEIAKELNISIKTVEYRLMCALRILRANLEEFLLLFVFLNVLG